ncbi:MerR family transcriptional regulator, partial [Fusobacterium vincentii]
MTIKEVSEQLEITQDTLRYYEKVGMIPPVTRTERGIRDYQEEDLEWVKLATCMRNAGLPVKVMIDYLNLYQQGNSTIQARCKLLKEQREKLLEQRKQIE